MSFVNNLARGSGLLFASSAASKLLTIFTLPILTALLSPAVYGEAALVATLSGFASVIALAGLDVSYTRAHFGGVGLDASQVEGLVWFHGVRNAIFAGILSALIWLVMARIVTSLNPELAIAVLFTVIGTLMSALSQTRARLHGHYRRLAVGMLAASIVAYGVILAFAFHGRMSSYALVVGGVVLAWVPYLSQAQPDWAGIWRGRGGIDVGTARQVLLVGLPAIITAPAFWFVSSADRWFLGVLENAETVGVYAIAVSFGTLGMMVNSAVQSAWIPEVVRAHENQTAQSSTEIAQGKRLVIALYALAWAGITAFSPDLVVLLTDARYHEAIPLVPWIAAGVFFYGCSHVFNTPFLLARRMDVMAKAWLVAVACHLCLSALLIPRAGMLGAAAAQALAFTAVAGILWWYGQRFGSALKLSLSFALQLSGLAVLAIVLHHWRLYGEFQQLGAKALVLIPVAAIFLWLNIPSHALQMYRR